MYLIFKLFILIFDIFKFFISLYHPASLHTIHRRPHIMIILYMTFCNLKHLGIRVSDTCGRRKALVPAILILFISGLLGLVFFISMANPKIYFSSHSFIPVCRAFQSNVLIFALFRLLSGMGGIGCFMASFVLAVEHIGSEVRDAFTRTNQYKIFL